MRLSASVMAHPVREQYVDQLLLALDADDVPVSWDEVDKPSSIGEQRWANGRNAWTMREGRDGDWHVVIQDDAIVCKDFLTGFSKALSALPDEALVASAYCGTKRPGQLPFSRIARQARSNDASWLRSLQLWWGVAVACRTDTIDDMLQWCDTKIGTPYDLRIGLYYREITKTDCWYTWPSLVDHRDGPSLIARGDTGRRAREFHDGSALELSWDGPVVDDPRMRQRDLIRERQAAKT